MIDVVIAGAGPDGLMLACELGLAGVRPLVLDPIAGPSPQARVNRIVGQAARILEHRGLYSALTGSADPPKPVAAYIFAGFPLDFSDVPESQLFLAPVQQQGLVQALAECADEYDTEIRWGHALTGFVQHDDGVTVHVAGPEGAYDLETKYLARDGRPLLVDLTESGAIAASVTDVADQLTVAAGHLVGELAATAVLVRPDGYVAWASSQPQPDPCALRELRAVLTHWFVI